MGISKVQYGRSRRTSIVLAVMGLMVTPVYPQQAVVLSAGPAAIETGQSFLTQYAQACYAVMPMHVAQEQGGRHNVRREGRRRLFGETEPAADLADDVGIARVRGIADRDCGLGASTIARSVDAQLKRNGIAVLRFVNGDGTVGQLAVTIVDNDGVRLLRVQPTHARNVIRKGLSGSQLVIDGAVVGMLVSVHARSGVGTVVRQDFLMSKVDAFLSAVANAPHQNEQQAKAVVSGMAPTIKAWNSPPIDASHHAQNLLADNDAKPWRSTPGQWPLVLDFSLGAQSTVVSGVELDGRGVPEHERPGKVEILIKPAEDARTWISVMTTTPDYRDGVATIRFAPRRSQLIRLSIASTMTAAQAVSLHRVRMLP